MSHNTTLENLVEHCFMEMMCLTVCDKAEETWAFTNVTVDFQHDENDNELLHEPRETNAWHVKRALMWEAKATYRFVLDYLLLARKKKQVYFRLPKWAEGLDIEDIVETMARRDYPDVYREFTLYRFWDGKELLYIGKSIKAFDRFKQHERTSPFYSLSDSVTMERYSTQEELDAAEVEAIRKEKPKYNRVRYKNGAE